MENKFTPIDIKMLKIFNRYLSSPSSTSFKKSLPIIVDKLGVDRKLAKKFYTLWHNNFVEDGSYENIEDPNLSTNPIYDIIKKLSDGYDEDDVDEKYMGSFTFCTNSFRERLPCISVDSDEVILSMDSDVWNKNDNLSGLYEDDTHFYYLSQGSYGYDNYTESNKEEFDYMYFNDETVNLVIELCELTGNYDDISKLKGEHIRSEDLSEILNSILESRDFNKIRDNYLYNLDYELDKNRRKETKEYYESKINYPPDQYGNKVSLTIPLEEFFEILNNSTNIILTFDDLLDLPFNSHINLTDIWYETRVDDEGYEIILTELNGDLRSIIDEYEQDEDKIELFKLKKEFDNYINKLGFKMVGSNGRYELKTKSNDKIFFLMKDVNLGENKILFHYNGEKHQTPIEELSNWVTGSVLNLESIIKKHLKKII